MSFARRMVIPLLALAACAPASSSAPMPQTAASASPPTHHATAPDSTSAPTRPQPPFFPFMTEAIPPPGAALDTDPRARDTPRQALAYVGREDRFASDNLSAPSCQALTRDGADADPIAEIVRRATSAQIVIVNEAHDAPDHRAFIADIAEALRPIGFTIFAAETFAPQIGRDGPSYPRVSDGIYSNEPAFGQLLRRARAAHYAFVPYETEELSHDPDPAKAIAAREEAEATNLVARIFAKDPHARVLIHVGYGHASETSNHGAFRAMALRLKEKTGIDPLTIDQTKFRAKDERRRVCSASADGGALSPAYDMYLMAPAVRFERHRPTWRIARGERALEVPQALRRPSERVIFEARRADEPSDAVPVDRVLVDPGEDVPLLVAPGRDYLVRACSASGECGDEVMVRSR